MFQKLLRVGEGKKLKLLESIVPEVARWEPDMERLTDAQLAAMTVTFKQRVDAGEDLDDLLPEAFAVVREASRRTLGQRHYDVQIMGGACLHFGWVAEMKTGEGKTLVATLPAYLNALTGRSVHLVTVNDYLAKRDAEWMGQVYGFLGLSVGVVIPGYREAAEEKRAAYDCDIIHGTNNELGFDYLRDNMCVAIEEQTQWGNRGRDHQAHHFAIIDEIDSILIDEARTPLIISGQVQDAVELYYQFARVVRGLQRERDYEVDEAKRTVVPTEEGIGRVEQSLGVTNLYDNVNQNFVHQLAQALKAKELFHRDKDYLVAQGEVKIVDEFTGRVLEGRRWSEGLHQAVEAKEGVRIKAENQTLATVTLQNYFRLYDKLAGMTGTAFSEAGEFMHTYELAVVSIPTNKPSARADQADLIYKGIDGKYDAVVEDIAQRHATGQPILVGTISVEESEKLSRLLDKNGVTHEVLNAKQHEREAPIIAQAGALGGVTVATNMAGRGVDILLGGEPEGLARAEMAKQGLDPETEPARYRELLDQFTVDCKIEGDKVRGLGGLFVLGTERHESRRIDNQLRGRSGRQGDPGETRFYLSLEDELMRLFATGLVQKVMGASFPDDVPLESRMVSKAIERAQGTVEDRNFEIRKNVLKYDEVMNEQRKIVYKLRQQILDGLDLKDEAMQIIERTIKHLVDTHCSGEFVEEWDVDSLYNEARSFFPTNLTREQMANAERRSVLEELVHDDAVAVYEALGVERTEEVQRDIERRVMLSVIDQHWREHLYEMDYLQEGINLRAMGQQDPLAEWQREGFDMFEAMTATVDEEFVRYVFHVQVITEDAPVASVSNVQYSAPEDPVEGTSSIRSAAAAELAEVVDSNDAARVAAIEASVPEVQQPVRVEKTPGRNEPCWCGSGKKYKVCHGK